MAVGEVDAVYGGGASPGSEGVAGIGLKGWGGNLSGVEEDIVDIRIYETKCDDLRGLRTPEV